MVQALVLFELGSIRTVPDNYNIKEVYEVMSNSTPVVFVLPSDIQDRDATDGTKGNNNYILNGSVGHSQSSF